MDGVWNTEADASAGGESFNKNKANNPKCKAKAKSGKQAEVKGSGNRQGREDGNHKTQKLMSEIVELIISYGWKGTGKRLQRNSTDTSHWQCYILYKE